MNLWLQIQGTAFERATNRLPEGTIVRLMFTGTQWCECKGTQSANPFESVSTESFLGALTGCERIARPVTVRRREALQTPRQLPVRKRRRRRGAATSPYNGIAVLCPAGFLTFPTMVVPAVPR